jgi:TetR/AcrR family transcriptional repressor of nem operon
MARTKEFDPETVLDRALDLFWARGYEATSMTDLVMHLGIARASLYSTFGGKHELYLRALERYLELYDPTVVEELSRPGPVLPQIRALITRYADESANDRKHLGCMVVNAAVELGGYDSAVGRLVEASWTNLETALTQALTRACDQNELPPGAKPQAIARFLLVLLQGMRVLGRAPGSKDRLSHATEQALALLN